jgi:hypothetical protein
MHYDLQLPLTEVCAVRSTQSAACLPAVHRSVLWSGWFLQPASESGGERAKCLLCALTAQSESAHVATVWYRDCHSAP